ncbi:MAG TPA: zf-HC2 domain-containing protein [Polyangiaceae bacterium]|nr:zf-HC2 domain-containing protein [Polyangiaceae bacterium]
MDCEKFESLLIDELYGELDEVTSAAVRRHAAGCARCGALLSGLRATRKVAALPAEDPSADLEDRILSAVREQQKVVPLRMKVAAMVSRAGAWAMRPQTAMAAVFLLVIGTSFVFMKQSHKADAPEGAMRVQAAGAPAAKAAPTAAASAIALDGLEAAHAHGVEEQASGRLRTVTAEGFATTTPGDLRDKDSKNLEEKEKAETRSGLAADEATLALNAGPSGGAPPQAPAAAPQELVGAGGGGASGSVARAVPAQGHASAQSPYASGGVGFSEAMQSYNQGRYDEAAQKFDTLGASDANAALWAARAVRDAHGCAAAIPRFEQVRARASTQPAGNEATWDAGRCYRSLGDTEKARARFAVLLSNPAYAARAQEELDAMAPVAAKRAAAPPRPAATATTAPATKKASADTGM